MYGVTRHGELAAVMRLNGLTHVSAINRRIRELVDAGLLRFAKASCRPVRPLEAPLLSCDPARGRFPYDRAAALSWQLERRWKDPPMGPAFIDHASKLALNVMGGVMTGSVRQPGHLTHDCQAAWLYVRYLKENPALARKIVSEHAHLESPYRTKAPDFVCHDSGDRPVLALEVGGFYPPARLVGLMKDLERRKIALELY